MYINDTVIVYTYEGQCGFTTDYNRRLLTWFTLPASLSYSVKELLKLDVIESITSEARARMDMS